MEQVLEAALRRKPKPLEVEPPKIIRGDDPIEPSPASRVRRSDFPTGDQPPVVVRHDRIPTAPAPKPRGEIRREPTTSG